jgi:hypothetical protein
MGMVKLLVEPPKRQDLRSLRSNVLVSRATVQEILTRFLRCNRTIAIVVLKKLRRNCKVRVYKVSQAAQC